MAKLVFPDGNIREYDNKTPLEIAESISVSLKKKVISAKLDEDYIEVNKPITKDGHLKLIVADDEDKDSLYVLRHTCAHVLAQALRRLYGKDVHFGVGPAIDGGFYYDFDAEYKVSEEDFKAIEKEKIVDNLKSICDKCHYEFDNSAMELIAELSEGAMRDALSILERCLQDSQKKVTIEKVKELVGIPETKKIFDVVEAIFSKNIDKVVVLSNEILDSGADVDNFLFEIIRFLRDTLVYKVGVKLSNSYTENDLKEIDKIIENKTKEELIFLIEKISKIENKIKNSFKEVGFKFSDRLLYAFHTSLKIGDWNPLTVLAGVSGTGKSELPRLYSRYGGINFLPLAVQSNWDSPYSLFGYYNSLEGKFNATSLLKVLYQAQEDAKNSISEYLTIVLLDEMNLAHVELYFSELLSKLELLRGSEEVKLEIDIAEKNPYEIKLNKNIIWVGTMNEDETTKSLSDKVIDRSNLINFPRPNEFVSRNELKESDEAPKLKREIWENWKWNKVKDELIKDENNVNNKEKIKKLEKRIDELKRKMEEINEYLKVSGKAIGHRVWQSIENYIRNYPLVLLSIKNQDDEEIEKAIQSAFEDALVQKLMPKLRGLDINGEIREECLNKIREKISTYANGIVSDFDNALKNPYGVFVWNSSEYLLDKNDK